MMRRRGHPSRVPFGSLGSPLTGPGAAAGQQQADRRKGQALARGGGGSDTAGMDREARDQYLRDLREEYRLAGKKAKGRLLDEAEKRTGLARKVVVRKLNHPDGLVRRPRKKRRAVYDGAVQAALVELWALFDYPCGQRLAPLLREQVPRLRRKGQWGCSEEVAGKLVRMSARTADRLLAGEKHRLRLAGAKRGGLSRLLLEQIPVKVADQWDRRQVGNVQLDFVSHCGQSTAGDYLSTLSGVDIATQWWEGEALVDRTQQEGRRGLDAIRRRLPFRMREAHPDNDSGLLNRLLVDYCRRNQIALSRSRPLKKNDNCWVEQKNWTHVRKLVGYHRMSGAQQQRLLNELYRLWALWCNFLRPVMRLVSKVRTGGRVHRVYDEPATPYQRLLASGQLSTMAREALQARYESIDPVALRRQIEQRQQQLHKLVLGRDNSSPSRPRKLLPRSVTSFMTQRAAVRLPD
ncbi:MAG: hypothetical protein DI604_35145 [Delftia acidovorans]|nr:MAG: hypothetical protein DI604_35145 [Delftia acidovorans]